MAPSSFSDVSRRVYFHCCHHKVLMFLADLYQFTKHLLTYFWDDSTRCWTERPMFREKHLLDVSRGGEIMFCPPPIVLCFNQWHDHPPNAENPFLSLPCTPHATNKALSNLCVRHSPPLWPFRLGPHYSLLTLLVQPDGLPQYIRPLLLSTSPMGPD